MIERLARPAQDALHARFACFDAQHRRIRLK
jgi:hypothetical protein